MDNVKLLGHSGIRLDGEKIIYVDRYKAKNLVNDADYIFITHNHYDHYSPEDILKLKNDNTIIVVTKELKEEVINIDFDESKMFIVEPNKNYDIGGLKFSTISSYNIDKKFHPKENGWVGYVIEMNNTSYYIPGDTDCIDEAKNVKCDIVFVPVGGTYTMNYSEAAELVNIIKPEVTIPIHYGSIVGSREDAKKFNELLDEGIKCEIIL